MCLIRSVLSIGGYYTYSNLFLFGFPRSFSPCLPRRVCAKLGFFNAHDNTLPDHATLLLPLLFCFLWFVRIIILAFCPFFLSLIDRISPSVALTPTSHVLGLVWSATSTRSPFAYMYFVQPQDHLIPNLSVNSGRVRSLAFVSIRGEGSNRDYDMVGTAGAWKRVPARCFWLAKIEID